MLLFASPALNAAVGSKPLLDHPLVKPPLLLVLLLLLLVERKILELKNDTLCTITVQKSDIFSLQMMSPTGQK